VQISAPQYFFLGIMAEFVFCMRTYNRGKAADKEREIVVRKRERGRERVRERERESETESERERENVWVSAMEREREPDTEKFQSCGEIFRSKIETDVSLSRSVSHRSEDAMSQPSFPAPVTQFVASTTRRCALFLCRECPPLVCQVVLGIDAPEQPRIPGAEGSQAPSGNRATQPTTSRANICTRRLFRGGKGRIAKVTKAPAFRRPFQWESQREV